MSRISQELAQSIAYKLTEKSRIACDKLHVYFREFVTCLYEEQTPEEVKKCLKNHPDWIQTNSTIRLDGHGFRWEYVTSTRPVIQTDKDNKLEMTAKVADKISSLKNKWEKSKKVYEELKAEAKQALLSLRTFNNIRKELPQAAPMLPPPISNALVVNFNSLKNRLNKQDDFKKQAVSV